MRQEYAAKPASANAHRIREDSAPGADIGLRERIRAAREQAERERTRRRAEALYQRW